MLCEKFKMILIKIEFLKLVKKFTYDYGCSTGNFFKIALKILHFNHFYAHACFDVVYLI